jgi:alkylation response protein AidB-like acyl-CoA dehydrogenase
MSKNESIVELGDDIEAGVAAWLAENWSEEITLRQWWVRLAGAGLSQPTWPSGLGGRDASPALARRITTALALAGVIGPPAGIGPSMGAPTVLAHGDTEQQARFVRACADGTQSWCQLFSEPGAGSDIASLATRAERDGDELIVTGQKVWNSGADTADVGMLVARTNIDVPKHRGISWMLVDMKQPGVEVRPLVQMNGNAEFCEVFLTEARVPIADVVGGIDAGWPVTRTTLSFERMSIGQTPPTGLVNVAAGTRTGLLDSPVGEVLERVRAASARAQNRFDVMVGWKTMIRLARETGKAHDRVVRDKVTRYYIASQVHRFNNQRTRDNAKSGRPGPEGSIGKLSNAMLAHMSRDISMSILGAEGMITGVDTVLGGRVQQACLGSHAPSLGGGTNEIQRNIIGERTLGLPREPSDDAEVAFRDLRRS